MKRTKFISYLILGVTAIMLTACVKEGPQGRPGRDGLNGLDGATNVISSPWYTPAAWNGITGDWYFDVNNSAISQDIVESGVILAYASIPGDIYNNAVRSLPAYVNGANWEFLIPNYGQIEFTSDMLNVPGTQNYSFRFILIPAGYSLKSTSLKSGINMDKLKTMPYKEVCSTLGIAE
jgi:hypothetical protein